MAVYVSTGLGADIVACDENGKLIGERYTPRIVVADFITKVEVEVQRTNPPAVECLIPLAWYLSVESSDGGYR
jgi:hypothetical protein